MSHPTPQIRLKTPIREVPDFPKPGILFYDITTLLKVPEGLREVIDGLCAHYAGQRIDRVVGIEARGFIFAPAIAYALNAGFVPICKLKKLPAATERVDYALEYGSDGVEIHKDGIEPGQNVAIVDDVLATGGTAAAAVRLVERLGGKVAGLSFVIELDALGGRAKLPASAWRPCCITRCVFFVERALACNVAFSRRFRARTEVLVGLLHINQSMN